MNNLNKILLFFTWIIFMSGCSQILQTVELEIKTKDSSDQEKFEVVEKTLTISEAKEQSNAPYERKVLQPGRGINSRPVLEKKL